ncbi:MAG: hypothetical protein AAFN10_08450 [Bacteroidota bacterium]
MMIRTVLLALALYCLTFSSYAQDLQACRIDYSPVQQALKPQAFQLEKGDHLTLSAQYLADVRAGHYTNKPSGMSHYVYLRPGSRKEIKESTVDHRFERMSATGDIFGIQTTASSDHFFRPDENFEGNYDPTWQDPMMIVPLGLNPIDITAYAHQLFKVVDTRFNYLLLEVNGDYLVFYPGFPETYEVFNNLEMQVMLQERQTWAETYVGKRLFVRNSADLRYRLSPHGKDLQLPVSRSELEIYVNSYYLDRHQVLFEYGMDEPLYLVLDEHARFEVYDAQCLERRQEAIFAEQRKEDLVAHERFNNVMQVDFPVMALMEDEWLQERLVERFQLSDGRYHKSLTYDYVGPAIQQMDLAPAIKVKVLENGDLVMRSIYASKDGLYHTKVELRIGGKTLISERVSTLDSRSSRRNVQGQTLEIIDYIPGGDQGILEEIARNVDQPIVIRYVAGGSFWQEVSLGEGYKKAIRDAWLFSHLLKENRSVLEARLQDRK